MVWCMFANCSTKRSWPVVGVSIRVFHEYCFHGQGLVFTADSHLAQLTSLSVMITVFLEEGPGTLPLTNSCKSWRQFSIGSITHSHLIAQSYFYSCPNVNKSKHRQGNDVPFDSI